MYARLENTLHPSPSLLKSSPATHNTNVSKDTLKGRTDWRRRIDWVAPFLMISSLLLGTALALGHHFFYQSLNLHVVENRSQQEWYGRIGTGLAFLVKTFLGIAIGTAFTQRFWLSLKRQNISVKSMDDMFSVLSNPLGFVNLKLWSNNVILLLLALAKWFIPLVAVVAPPTLTPDFWNFPSSPSMVVPELNFDTSGFALVGIAASAGAYAAPQPSVMKIITSSALQGIILPIQPPASNCSYSIDFLGPALSCSVYHNITSGDEYPTFLMGTAEMTNYEYLAWAGPFENFNDSNTRSKFPIGDISEQGGSPATLWINVNTTILQCTLFNASYSASFQFSSGKQNIHIKTNHLLNTVTSDANLGPDSASSQELAYDAIMGAFGQVFVGSITRDQYLDVDVSGTLIQATSLGMNNSVNGPLMEELFRNVTISLLNDEVFWKDESSATSVPVQIQNYELAYIYKPDDLYIAYGCAILITCLSVLVGCRSIFKNNAAYSNNFSTVLRMTRDETFDLIVSKEHQGGEDPLPGYIAKARVEFDSTLRLRGGKSSGRGDT